MTNIRQFGPLTCFKAYDGAASLARHIHVVAAGLAVRCTIQLAYTIGVANPLLIYADTFGAADVDPAKIVRVMDQPPRGIRAHLCLRPRMRRTASSVGS